MTRTFDGFAGLLLILACLLPGPLARAAEETFHVVQIRYLGLERTDQDWLESYVEMQLPAELTTQDVARLQSKLMTTGVFTTVKIVPEPSLEPPGAYVLAISVEEKWTTIPVIRGVYGGGTPLRILGMYDIHSFGRLITLGGEMRRYGDAPPGFVVYGRDPRSNAGRYYLGAEFWRDFRRRQLYGRDGEKLGAVSTNAAISRIRLLTPFASSEPGAGGNYAWKYGFDFEVVQEAPAIFDAEGGQPLDPPGDLELQVEERRQSKALPTVLYDDVAVDNIEYDGVRSKLKAGPVIDKSQVHSTGEIEAFYYRLLGNNLNFGVHAVAGQSSANSLQNQYFLGGLDSIRGLPDGAIYGTHAAWLNVELRHLSFKTRYLWFQTATFLDAGGAALSWSEAGKDVRAATGFGLRLAVPQIYRMLFRIDYAWSIDGSRTQGITAGMNQFFDPYIPL